MEKNMTSMSLLIILRDSLNIKFFKEKKNLINIIYFSLFLRLPSPELEGVMERLPPDEGVQED